MFSVSTDSQGSDEAPVIGVAENAGGVALTGNTTTLLVLPEASTATLTQLDSGSTGTGMTVEFKTDGSGNILTPVRILNMGSGFDYGDTITITDDAFGGDGTGSIVVTLGTPATKTDSDPITTPGGLFSGNPSGASLSSVSELDVLNVSNSLKMLTAVDGALVRIDLERSDLGATMSRMEHTISNLSNIVMNTKAARSRIADADIALESTELSKAQVLNQAAQAMLAQANKAQQSILQLLN